MKFLKVCLLLLLTFLQLAVISCATTPGATSAPADTKNYLSFERFSLHYDTYDTRLSTQVHVVTERGALPPMFDNLSFHDRMRYFADIDFTQNLVILAFMGAQSRQGPAITIEKMWLAEGAIYVQAYFDPGPAEQPGYISWPCDGALISRDGLLGEYSLVLLDQDGETRASGACVIPEPTLPPPPRSDPLAPPSLEELTRGGYAHPEIQRITAEALKPVLDRVLADEAYTGRGAAMMWNDFTLIDVQPESDVDGLGRTQYTRSYLLGSTNIPFDYYWVTDPERELSPEELLAYRAEQDSIAQAIAKLRRDKPVILCDTTGDDAAACALALKLIEAGFDPGQVSVLWQGFNHWAYDLGYPYSSAFWGPSP